MNHALAAFVTLTVLGFGSGWTWAEPTLEVIRDEKTAHPGQPIHLICEVSWRGGAGDYAILPAEVEPFDWGMATVTESRAFVRDGLNVVSQAIAIVPAGTGEFTLPEIQIPYITPEDISPPEQPENPANSEALETLPKLKAGTSPPFQVHPDATPIWLFGGLGGVVILAAVAWWVVNVRKYRRVEDTAISAEVPVDTHKARQALHAAQQRRIEGDYYGFYRELHRAHAAAAPDGQSLAARLEARAQDAGYRGARPAEHDMDGDLREVERVIRACEDNTEDAPGTG